MAAPLRREQLDRAQCDTPGCQHEDHSELWLYAACHPSAKLEVAYEMTTGTIRIVCARCKQQVAAIAVAA